MFIYVTQKIARIITRLLADVFLKFKVVGKNNFKLLETNQYFIVSNHFGYMDAFLVSDTIPFYCFLKTNFRYMTTPKWIKAYPFISWCGAYPIQRNMGSIEETLKETEKLIKDGKSLLIFPEGAFAKDGKKIKPRQGISYLAKKYNMPIVPVFLSGSGAINGEDRLDFKKLFSRKYKAVATVGKPFYYTDVVDENTNLHDAAQVIMDKVNELG